MAIYDKNNIEVEIADRTVADIQNIIAQYEAKELSDEVIQEKNEQLKIAARKFISVYHQAEEDIKNYNALQIARAKTRDKINATLNQKNKPIPEELYNLDERISETTNNYSGKFKEFFDAVMVFNDDILTIIYGKPVETVIMVETVDGPRVYSFTIQELLNAGGVTFVETFESKSHTLVGRIQLNIEKLTMTQAKIKQLNSLKLKDFDIGGLNQAYLNAKIDWNHFYTLTKVSQAFFKSQRTNDIWFNIFIGGKLGDIAEAYSYFYLAQKFAFREDPWNNLTVFFNEGVQYVDSVSGLYATDVETDTVNYAIKASKASLPGYKQMVKLANDILNETSKGIDIIKLVKTAYKKQYETKKTDEPIRKGLRNKVSQVAANTISSLQLSSYGK